MSNKNTFDRYNIKGKFYLQNINIFYIIITHKHNFIVDKKIIK